MQSQSSERSAINSEAWVVDVVDARYVGDCRLEISFSDQTSQVIDFGPFLQRSVHPDIRKYLDAEKFRGFALRDGDLVWGNYELCFPVADLYDGVI